MKLSLSSLGSWIIFSTFLLLSPTLADDSKTVEIFTPDGAIVGEKYSVQGKNIIRFLGIPYAQPPVGKLRFRRPVPASKHVESLQALSWPRSCIQYLTLNNTDLYRSKNVSEDCLYLNIWSPGVNADENHQRPVIIFIHGGSYLIGSSSFELYDGEILASMADAVIVTIQYRLSSLGFFYAEKMDNITGNQGLWDQAMAMQWVIDNIRYFGGNSKQITLMGNSAGAWSVSLHLLSPITRDLFQNAILLSGAAMNNLFTEPRNLEARMMVGVRQVGCATENNTHVDEAVFACLEQLDPYLVDKIWHSANNFKFYDPPQLVVIDDEFLPAKPMEMLQTGNHKKNFNLLLSTVEDEGSFILESITSSAKFQRNDPEPITIDQAKEFLNNLLNEVLKTNVENSTVNKLYFAGLNKNFDNQNLFRKQVGVAYGDLVITCPTIEFAKQIFKSSPETINVYQWYYTAKIGKEKNGCSKWMGTCHCDELYPLFGKPFQNATLYHNREREISNEIINVLKSFMRKGQVGENQSEWLSYFLANDGKSVCMPYYEISNDLKSYKSFKFDLKQTKCNVLWNKYFTR